MFRDNRGLPGVDAARRGVFVSSSGDESGEDAGLRDESGGVVLPAARGVGMDSDISRIKRLWTVDEDAPNDVLRKTRPPLITKSSAMIHLVLACVWTHEMVSICT